MSSVTPLMGFNLDGEQVPVPTPGIGDVTEKDMIEDAFSNADCWALALALFDRYQHLTLWALSEEEEDGELHWVHMLVRDERDTTGDTFVDIFGPQPGGELMLDWEWNPEWETLDAVPEEEILAVREQQPRLRPHVTVETGIAHIIAQGWEPPPLRQN